MSVGVESLFTRALGLVPPWEVAELKLDTARQRICWRRPKTCIGAHKRIDFEIRCTAKSMACPHCGKATPVHDRLHRSWRHLDFFLYEAWLHAEVPRVACDACGKTAQVDVP